MSKFAYTDPLDATTLVTAEAMGKIKVGSRPQVYCGAKNFLGEICTCPMHYIGASGDRTAYFAAYDANKHISGCPNCFVGRKRTYQLWVKGERTTLDDLLQRMSKPAKEETADKSQEVPKKERERHEEADDDTRDRKEEITNHTRLPRNAGELLAYTEDNIYGEGAYGVLGDMLLDAETVCYHNPTELEGVRLVVATKDKPWYYRFPPVDPATKLYMQGEFTIVTQLDGAPNIQLRLRFRNGKDYKYKPCGKFPPIYRTAIKLKKDLFELKDGKLVVFGDLRYIGEEAGRYTYECDITGRNQVSIIAG